MSDDIKEILEAMAKIQFHGTDLALENKDTKILLDYITKLQEENERLSRTTVMYDELLCSKNNIIDKAIEYINTHYLNANEPKLLNILKGEDNE